MSPGQRCHRCRPPCLSFGATPYLALILLPYQQQRPDENVLACSVFATAESVVQHTALVSIARASHTAEPRSTAGARCRSIVNGRLT